MEVGGIFHGVYLGLILLDYLYIAYVDFRKHYIEDLAVLIGIVLTVVYTVIFRPINETWMAIYWGFIGFAIHYVIYKIAMWYYREEAFGFGDVLLMASLGCFLTDKYFGYLLVEIMVSGIFGVIVMILKKGNIHYELPLAPLYVVSLGAFFAIGAPDVFELFWKAACML